MVPQLLLLVLVAFSGRAWATTEDYQFVPSPISNQMTHKSARVIFQDSRGMLWLLGDEGLNRYDGYELRRYRHDPDDPSSLGGDALDNIVEDSAGDLWISIHGGGLSRYVVATDSFVTIRHDPESANSPLSNRVSALVTGDNGDIWLGYTTGGFSRYQPSTGSFVHFPPGSTEGVGEFSVPYLAWGQDGSLWVATWGGGLLRLLPDGKTLRRYGVGTDASAGSLPSDRVFIPMVDRRGRLWVATEADGVSMLPPGASEFVHFRYQADVPGALPPGRVHSMREDREGYIWIGLDKTLVRMEPDGSFRRFDKDNSGLKLTRWPTSIYQTEDGTLWVGGNQSGVFKGRRLDFSLHKVGEGLIEGPVNAFAETAGGQIWVGTDWGLSSFYPDRPGNRVSDNSGLLPGLSELLVTSLLGEGRTLWVGTSNAGLYRVNLDTGDVTGFRHDSGDLSTLGANAVTAIYRDQRGRLWVTTLGGGLNLFDEHVEHFTRFTYDPSDEGSIGSNVVVSILEDSMGALWLCTRRGLSRMNEDGRTFENFGRDPEQWGKFGQHMVSAMLVDSRSDLWIGTLGGGVSRWAPEYRYPGEVRFDNFTERLELPSTYIYGIASSPSGLVWFSHNAGLTVFDPETQATRHFNVNDGLQENEFNGGATFQDSSGRLYFGGPSGFNIIPADYQLPVQSPPRALISEIKVLNEPVAFELDKQPLPTLELTHRDHLLSVSFAAVDYSNPQENRYRYKLAGFDKEWIELGRDNTVTFSNLPAGDYVLRVQASNPAGAWNDNAITLPVSISPSPWLSWPAKVVYLLILSGLVLYAIRRQQLKAARILATQQLLETQVAERTADLEEARQRAEDARQRAEDANLAKSAFLATMTHEIRTPMHGMLGMTELLMDTGLDNQQRRYANTAHRSGQALLGLINSILDFSKLDAAAVQLERRSFNLLAMLDDLCFLESEPAARKGIDLNLVYAPDLGPRIVGDEGKTRQVILNLLSNAIKFTEAGRITMRARRVGDSVQIEVEDTGVGMDAEAQSRAFDVFTQADASTTRKFGGSGLGLSIAKQYVELMGGSIDVESSPGVGSRFTLSLPGLEAEQDYQPPQTDLRCAVLCVDSSTREMVRSRLARHGVDVHEFATIDSLLHDQVQIDLAVVDRPSLGRIDSNQLQALSATPYPGFALVSLLDADLPGELPDWISLTRPLTEQALEQLLDAFTDCRRKPPEQQATSLSPSFQCRVLVAEDVEVSQTIAREMLGSLGCDVTMADNGEQAVEYYRNGTFDIVFMDCQMPLLDGYEASRRIREIERAEGREPVTIVALTAAGSATERERIAAAGMSAWLGKPYSQADISAHLSALSNESPVLPVPGSLQGGRADADDGIADLYIVDYLRQLTGQNGECAWDTMYASFIAHMEEQLPVLRELIDAGDSKNVGRTAHAIKSAASCVGASAVIRVCSLVEDMVGEGSPIPGAFANDIDQAYRAYCRLVEQAGEEAIRASYT